MIPPCSLIGVPPLSSSPVVSLRFMGVIRPDSWRKVVVADLALGFKSEEEDEESRIVEFDDDDDDIPLVVVLVLLLLFEE